MKMPSKHRITLFVTLALVMALSAVACRSDGDPTVEASPTLASAVVFPYIFSGNLTVNGEPGPQDVPVFARLGNGRGPFNNTVRPGVYTNVSIAPGSADDVGKEITFFLGHPDGPNVQADQTYTFNSTSQPVFVTLNLNFPKLP